MYLNPALARSLALSLSLALCLSLSLSVSLSACLYLHLSLSLSRSLSLALSAAEVGKVVDEDAAARDCPVRLGELLVRHLHSTHASSAKSRMAT